MHDEDRESLWLRQDNSLVNTARKFKLKKRGDFVKWLVTNINAGNLTIDNTLA